eukprot:1157787-Pelagomonas_calceolata.AAC.2
MHGLEVFVLLTRKDYIVHGTKSLPPNPIQCVLAVTAQGKIAILTRFLKVPPCTYLFTKYFHPECEDGGVRCGGWAVGKLSKYSHPDGSPHQHTSPIPSRKI